MDPDYYERSCQTMDIHVDELAAFVFKKNPVGASCNLSIEGIETTKDLFFFLLDLLCKGIVMLFGQNGVTVDLSTISRDNFQLVAKRMAAAGIVVRLALPDCAVCDLTQINIPQLTAMPDNAPLESFVFRIAFNSVMYELSFALSRV